MALKPPYVHVTTFDGINLQDCELHTKSCCLKAYKENEQWKHFIKEEIQFLQQPITNKQLSVSMFDTFSINVKTNLFIKEEKCNMTIYMTK